VAVAYLGKVEQVNEHPIRMSHESESQNINEHAWFAVQVRSQHEKAISLRLAGAGYAPFLPVYKCRRRWSDRVKEVMLPLFPGYLFCRLDPKVRLPILKTPGVIQIVGSNRIPIPVEDTEIEAIRRLVSSGLPAQPWPFLAVGDRVRIECGPLRGVEGILTAFKGTHRLLVSITLLQRSVAVEIDSAFVRLESADRSARAAKAVLDAHPALLPT
jgi:transcription antitermination factor NusG